MKRIKFMFDRTPVILEKLYGGIHWKTSQNVLFTFDDGPSEYTLPIAKLLFDYNHKAIFFIQGNRFNRDICQTLIDLGHDIGWHSNSHANFLKLTNDEIVKELEPSNSIQTSLNYTIKYFRFPYGYFRKRHLEIVKKFGFETMLWSLKFDDYKMSSINQLLKKFKKIKKNDILLFHDYSQNAENLVKALTIYLGKN